MLGRWRPLPGGIPRRVWQAALLWTAFIILVWTVNAVVGTPPAGAQAVSKERGQAKPIEQGETLWRRDCASCHGVKGEGTAWGPNLQDKGPADVHLMVATGRMPIDQLEPLQRQPYNEDDMQVGRNSRGGTRFRRGDPVYRPGQISALVAYARTILNGPDKPVVDVSGANISHGSELFDVNCAACHSWNARGGALANGHAASPLDHTTPTEVVEAMRAGLGAMPRFPEGTISNEDAADIAAYVKYLHHPRNEGGFPMAYIGPAAEGFAAWLVGIVGLLLFVRWIGQRS